MFCWKTSVCSRNETVWNGTSALGEKTTNCSSLLVLQKNCLTGLQCCLARIVAVLLALRALQCAIRGIHSHCTVAHTEGVLNQLLALLLTWEFRCAMHYSLERNLLCNICRQKISMHGKHSNDVIFWTGKFLPGGGRGGGEGGGSLLP